MGLSSKKLIKHFQSMAHWCNGLERITACWRANEIGVEYTEEERKQLNEASCHLEEAKQIMSAIYSKRIGDAVTFEIRCGEFK